MTPQTLPDIIGASSSIPLVATPGTRKARHIMFTATSGTARWGGASVGAAQGQLIPQSVPVTTPANEGDETDMLDLASVYVYVPIGTTLTVTLLV